MTDSRTAPAAQAFSLSGIPGSGPSTLSQNDADNAALTLRLGIGSVFIVGGWWKLQRAIDADRADALVAKYTASSGYINSFFQDYLFADGFLSAWGFLTLLSSIELLAGIALVAGFLVRPIAIVFGLLMWSFVAALPVMTVPGAEANAKTFLTPALIVQIRDIGLSGMCFALAALGSGAASLDQRFMGGGASSPVTSWSGLGLLLRLSLAVPFLAGGFFFGLDHVKSWIGSPLLLIAIGLVLASGHFVRIAAASALLVLVTYSLSKIGFDKSLWDNLNAIKREFAFIALAALLIRFSGGQAFRLMDMVSTPREVFFGRSRQAA